MPRKKAVILIIAAVFTAMLLGACTQASEQISSLSQLREKGTVIAVSTNTPESKQIIKDFPDAVIESYTDIYPAYQEVASGKITAVISQRTGMQKAIENGVSGVRLLEENYRENVIAVGLSRKSDIPDLKRKINKFLQELRDDGTLDDMYERWVMQKDYTMPDIPEAEAPKRTLTVATTGTAEPFTFYVGNELSGYDIELAKRFAAWLGARLEFKVYDWGGLLSAAQAGDADCIMSNLYYEPEYEETTDFSDPLFTLEITAMVRDKGYGAKTDPFWQSLRSSFRRTFITERRWKLFISGIGTTLLITGMSILLGTLLGFAVFTACRKGNRTANAVIRFSVWLVQGMPAVVLLMLLYYVVFGSVKIPGVAVAIIGFTLICGASVYERMKAGVSAVDIGQTEAAYSLGYTERQAFYKVVLPQAMPFIIPPFKGDITALLKGTSVVGYIAVQDLTKMADIVRSRTYEAFFPLIAVAVIYLILEVLFNFIVDRLEPAFYPKRRDPDDILKGVQQK
jgi:polar amino acid transport system substrate-binding protein